ncbi:MAG: HPr family phosphocarrier protein [Pseudomonadales bacterium]|nr:HPr family phosphocarrier protein [Pseudomonadales bacterium]MEE2893453.1 HPr family phosphocarrier protein [Pseudomonadota bacterium]
MPRRTLDIVNRLGLHARAAAQFVKVAGAYGARVSVEKDGQSADGKSIMAVMMLAAAKGAQITVETEGPDADAALEAITELIADCFGEDD